MVMAPGLVRGVGRVKAAGLEAVKAGAMAVVLVLTALVQFLVPVAALILSEQDFAPGVIPVIALNGGWVVLFLFSAIMFSHARNDAEQESAL
jgi:NADH:ubiquinone oxidoreductase subunit 6 (subunit J)